MGPSGKIHKEDQEGSQDEIKDLQREVEGGPVKEDQGDLKMTERRFKHWAYLNEEGMKIFGAVFPDTMVPVLSFLWQVATLPIGDKEIFMVSLDELTDEQMDLLFEILVEKFDAPREEIEKHIKEDGLPLRRELTKGSGTNHIGLVH